MNNLLRKTRETAVLTLTVGLLAGCGSSTSPTHENSPAVSTTSSGETLPKVVATSSVLCDLTQQIAKDTIDLTCLVKAGTDPHVYEPTPEDRKAIEDAQLILYSGYDLEPSLEKILKSTSNPAPKIAVAEVAVPKPLMGEGHHQHEGEEAQEHEGAEKREPDPHVWHDAKNGIQMVDAIAANLEKVIPDRAELYPKNAEAIKTELTQIENWIQSQLATIPQASRKLITTHDALGYYANAYSIPVEGALQGLSTEQKPTAARLKELIENVKASKVPSIFAEVTVNPKLIETVAKEANVKISDRELFADGLGEAGSEGETYQKMLIANTQTLVEGLGGQFTPFPKSFKQSE
jgi:manganese/iron transport system substrate-binding protein